jgi:hypothetical protein
MVDDLMREYSGWPVEWLNYKSHVLKGGKNDRGKNTGLLGGVCVGSRKC